MSVTPFSYHSTYGSPPNDPRNLSARKFHLCQRSRCCASSRTVADDEFGRKVLTKVFLQHGGPPSASSGGLASSTIRLTVEQPRDGDVRLVWYSLAHALGDTRPL